MKPEPSGPPDPSHTSHPPPRRRRSTPDIPLPPVEPLILPSQGYPPIYPSDEPILPSQFAQRPIHFNSPIDEFNHQHHLNDGRTTSMPNLPSTTTSFTRLIYRPHSAIPALHHPIRGWYKNKKGKDKFIVDEPPKRKFGQLPLYFMEWIYPYLTRYQDKVNFAHSSSKPYQAFYKIRCLEFGFGRPVLELTKKTWAQMWFELRDHRKTCDAPYCTNAGRKLAIMPFYPSGSVDSSLTTSGTTTPWSTDTNVISNVSEVQPSNQGIRTNSLIEYYIQSGGLVGPDKFLDCKFRKMRKRVTKMEILARLNDFAKFRPHRHMPPPENLRDHPCLASALFCIPPQKSLVVRVNITSEHWGEIRYGSYILCNPDGITLLDIMHSLQLSMNQNIKHEDRMPMYHQMLDEDEYKVVRDSSPYQRMKIKFNKRVQKLALRTRPLSVNIDPQYFKPTRPLVEANWERTYRQWEAKRVWLAAQPRPAPFIDKFSNWSGMVRVRRKNVPPWEKLHLMSNTDLQVLSASTPPDIVQLPTGPRNPKAPWESIHLPPFSRLPPSSEGIPLVDSPFSITPSPRKSSKSATPPEPQRGSQSPPITQLASPTATEESTMVQTPSPPIASSSSPRRIGQLREEDEEEEEPPTVGYASSGTKYSPPKKPEGYVAVPTTRKKLPPIQELSRGSDSRVDPAQFGGLLGGPTGGEADSQVGGGNLAQHDGGGEGAAVAAAHQMVPAGSQQVGGVSRQTIEPAERGVMSTTQSDVSPPAAPRYR
ncbi:hypothetical protein I302_107438 [Kwoniella bestiolae CBS 10118]|uniref:Uncharacterized protein n=1 Tax=Kwoniella bestiolae CBS 10118 TaxID=1296100 RepID=A0A1B9FYI7_9TREE|nr:hypothetical protein I302_06821 [Kwoniella bestiolae CBS 10118]OCF23837.1 hypothetical protein I302_06821 [Kwoniella bestiolae CBS 10118]